MPGSIAVGLLALVLAPDEPQTAQKRAEVEAREREMSSVWVTTNRALVQGCTKLGGIGIHDSNDLDHLRRGAARLGGDVIRLRSLRDDEIFGDIYRCAEWDPLNPPTPTPTPTDKQRASRKFMEEMKARVRIVEDPSLVSGCEKTGERPANVLDDGEDLLRGSAVGGRSNVILLRRFEGSTVLGEFFRCSASQLQALPSPTPASARTPSR